MTNREAIEWLYNSRGGTIPNTIFEEVFNMAIKALEQ